MGWLNAEFVEWLMGVPIGWSALAPLEGFEVPVWGGDHPSPTAARPPHHTRRIHALGNALVWQCGSHAWGLLCARLLGKEGAG